MTSSEWRNIFGPRPLLRGLQGIKGLFFLLYSEKLKLIFFNAVSFVVSQIEIGYMNVKVLSQFWIIKGVK